MEYELERDALLARIAELEGEQLLRLARISELEIGCVEPPREIVQ